MRSTIFAISVVVLLGAALGSVLISGCEVDEDTYDCSGIKSAVDQCVQDEGQHLESQCNYYADTLTEEPEANRCSDTERAYDCYKAVGGKCTGELGSSENWAEMSTCALMMPD